MNSEPENSNSLAWAQQHLNQAKVYYEQTEEFDKALQECEAALELDPYLADAHNLRGILLEELGRKLEALKAYQQALQVEPDFSEAKNNLAALKAELAANSRLVTIATFGYPTEAYISKTKLDSEGIWSFVADEYTVTMNWLYSNAIGGVKLQVKEADIEKALAALTQNLPNREFIEEDIEESEERFKCPSCGGINLTYQRYATGLVFGSWLLSWLSFIFFFGMEGGFVLPFLKRKWHCQDCKFEWKAD